MEYRWIISEKDQLVVEQTSKSQAVRADDIWRSSSYLVAQSGWIWTQRSLRARMQKRKEKSVAGDKNNKGNNSSIIFGYYGSTNVASAVFTSLLVGPPKVTWTDIVFQTTAITSVIFLCNKPVRIGSILNKKIWRSNWGQPESKLHKTKHPNPQFVKFINRFFWPRCAV